MGFSVFFSNTEGTRVTKHTGSMMGGGGVDGVECAGIVGNTQFEREVGTGSKNA